MAKEPVQLPTEADLLAKTVAEAIKSTIERIKQSPASCVKFSVYYSSFLDILHQPQSAENESAISDAMIDLWLIHREHCPKPEGQHNIQSHLEA